MVGMDASKELKEKGAHLVITKGQFTFKEKKDDKAKS